MSDGIVILACAGGHVWDDEQYRCVVDGAVDHAVLIIDVDRRVRRVNRGAELLFGYQAGELIGRPLAELFPGPDRVAGRPEEEFAIATRRGVCSDEGWQQRRTGERFFASGSLTRVTDGEGTILGFVKILRDETRRRHLEEDLGSYRDRLEFAQGVSHTGTFEWNLTSGDEIWTAPMYRLYQIPTGITIATYSDWLQLVHPHDQRGTERIMAEAIAFRQPIVADFRILVPGGVRWIGCRAEAVYAEDGRPLRVVGIQTDITERKEAEEALRRANRDLEQFAYVASHDLQEPLRMVSSYLTLLQRSYGEALDDRARRYIGFAVDGAARLQRMIASLLEFARLDRDPPRHARVDVQHVVTEALHDLGGRLTDSGARIEVGDMPVVWADRDQLTRLFLNLISNAVKYRRPEVPLGVSIHAQRSDREWRFAIADNGRGIPDDQHQRIFELFQRLEVAPDIPGSGIGLAVCRKIVEHHHGRIWVDSRPGHGSTFRFSLPDVVPDEGERPATSGEAHGSSG